MPFRPLYDRHAIHEVAFVVNLVREVTPDEVKKVVDQHSRWKEQLPKANPITIHKLLLANQPIPANMKPHEDLGLAGVSFDALKRDGSLDWRLKIDRSSVIVNCLSYTRWNDIWPTARIFLEQVSELIIGDNLPVSGLALQYIDQFVWEGNEKDYKLDELFNPESEFICKNIVNYTQPLWHLYQGWFVEEGLPVAGRRLQKVHIDSVQRVNDYMTRIDTTLRHDFADIISAHNAIFGNDSGNALIDNVMSAMHDESKRLVAGLITTDMAERIGLDA